MLALFHLSQSPDSCSAPTRTRTRNSSLGPRHEVPFHHRGERTSTTERKARDSNPHAPGGALLSGEARPTVSGYLPSFTNQVDPPGVEPGPPPCHSGALPLGHEPVIEDKNGPPGSRTPLSDLRRRCPSAGPAAHQMPNFQRVQPSSRGESRTPTPRWARVSETRAFTRLRHPAMRRMPKHSVVRAGVEPASSGRGPEILPLDERTE
jgi:hypothetical protein